MLGNARVASTQNDERAALGKAAPSNRVRLATQNEPTRSVAGDQGEAERCALIARRHALAAVCLGGALALQEAALSRHYAGRSAALMIGGVR